MKERLAASVWTAAATLLAPIAWGTSYVTITELLPDGRPLLVAALRVVPSGLVLLIAGVLAARWRPRGAEWWRTGMLAVFNFGIFFPLLAAAVYRLPGGVAAAVGGLQPLFVVAVSRLVTGRRPRVLDLAVGCVAALGVGLVVIRPGADLDPVGLLAAVGANVSFAVGVVLTKRFPAPSNRLAAAGWQLLMGGVILVPLTVIVEGAPPSLTGRNVAGFAYLSLVGTALAFALWFNGIRRLPAAAPPLLGLAAPVTGALLGWAILGQSLSPLQLTGFAVTLAAIAYGASLRASAPGAAPPPERLRPVLERRPPGEPALPPAARTACRHHAREQQQASAANDEHADSLAALLKNRAECRQCLIEPDARQRRDARETAGGQRRSWARSRCRREAGSPRPFTGSV